MWFHLILTEVPSDAFHSTLKDLFEFFKGHLLHTMLVHTCPAHPQINTFHIQQFSHTPMGQAVYYVTNGIFPGVWQHMCSMTHIVFTTYSVNKCRARQRISRTRCARTITSNPQSLMNCWTDACPTEITTKTLLVGLPCLFKESLKFPLCHPPLFHFVTKFVLRSNCFYRDMNRSHFLLMNKILDQLIYYIIALFQHVSTTLELEFQNVVFSMKKNKVCVGFHKWPTNHHPLGSSNLCSRSRITVSSKSWMVLPFPRPFRLETEALDALGVTLLRVVTPTF